MHDLRPSWDNSLQDCEFDQDLHLHVQSDKSCRKVYLELEAAEQACFDGDGQVKTAERFWLQLEVAQHDIPRQNADPQRICVQTGHVLALPYSRHLHLPSTRTVEACAPAMVQCASDQKSRACGGLTRYCCK